MWKKFKLQTLVSNIKIKCDKCNEILEYKILMNHCHWNNNYIILFI